MQQIQMLIFFVLLCRLSYGQNVIKISSQDEAQIDSVGYLYLANNQVPGMGIGVLKNGKILYSKGLGIMDLYTQEPVTDKTVFHMASVSKPFVSTAIVQLLEQGKIQLDDLVTDHLPYFIMNDDRFDDMPMILETVDDTIWDEEIKMLRGFVK